MACLDLCNLRRIVGVVYGDVGEGEIVVELDFLRDGVRVLMHERMLTKVGTLLLMMETVSCTNHGMDTGLMSVQFFIESIDHCC